MVTGAEAPHQSGLIPPKKALRAALRGELIAADLWEVVGISEELRGTKRGQRHELMWAFTPGVRSRTHHRERTPAMSQTRKFPGLTSASSRTRSQEAPSRPRLWSLVRRWPQPRCVAIRPRCEPRRSLLRSRRSSH